MKQQRQIRWWQVIITLLGIASCIILVGMTAFDPAPACSGGQCMPGGYYQHGTPGPPEPICGDGVCDEGESSYNCVIDCGNWCGDGICAKEEINTCCGPGTDCTIEVTCGDGVCSACENFDECPDDCGVPTSAPSDTPEPSDTPAPTNTPRPAPTTSDSQTPTPTLTPTTEEEAQAEGEEPSPTPTDTPSPTPEVPVCEVIDPGSLAANLQKAFADQMSEEFPPVFLTCDKLPNELCLSLDANLDVATAFEQIVGRTVVNPGENLDLTLEDVTDLRLNYCTSGGQCVTYAVKSFDTEEGLICFGLLGGVIEPNCEEACIFALGNEQSAAPPEEPEEALPEKDSLLKRPVFLALGGVLLIAVLALVVLLYMSSRYEEEEDYDDDINR